MARIPVGQGEDDGHGPAFRQQPSGHHLQGNGLAGARRAYDDQTPGPDAPQPIHVSARHDVRRRVSEQRFRLPRYGDGGHLDSAEPQVVLDALTLGTGELGKPLLAWPQGSCPGPAAAPPAPQRRGHRKQRNPGHAQERIEPFGIAGGQRRRVEELSGQHEKRGEGQNADDEQPLAPPLHGPGPLPPPTRTRSCRKGRQVPMPAQRQTQRTSVRTVTVHQHHARPIPPSPRHDGRALTCVGSPRPTTRPFAPAARAVSMSRCHHSRRVRAPLGEFSGRGLPGIAQWRVSTRSMTGRAAARSCVRALDEAVGPRARPEAVFVSPGVLRGSGDLSRRRLSVVAEGW